MVYLSGPVLCVLMRTHRVTIRTLAQRMAIPLCRIRQVRQVGLTCPYAARDWVEAITGHDPGPVTRPITLTQEKRHHALCSPRPARPEDAHARQ